MVYFKANKVTLNHLKMKRKYISSDSGFMWPAVDMFKIVFLRGSRVDRKCSYLNQYNILLTNMKQKVNNDHYHYSHVVPAIAAGVQ